MRFLSGIIGAFALSVITSPAHAGAWTEDKGSGELILTGSYYNATSYWDNKGEKQSQPAYSKYELNPYMEYGLWDGITIGGELFLDRAHQDAAPGGTQETNWGLGESDIFLRGRLWQKNGFVISAEPMVKLPSPESSVAAPQLDGAYPDAGLGLSAGYSFTAFGLNHFADVDTQYRYRFGPSQNQVNLTGTFGIGIAPRWTIMPQAFVTYRASTPQVAAFTESPADDYNLVKLQLSTLYALTDKTSLQIGASHDLDGKNTGSGNAVLLGLWEHW